MSLSATVFMLNSVALFRGRGHGGQTVEVLILSTGTIRCVKILLKPYTASLQSNPSRVKT